MGRAKLAALRTSKALALLKIQLQKQSAWFAFKSAFRYFPSRFELQGRRKYNASGVIAHCSPLEGIYKGRQ